MCVCAYAPFVSSSIKCKWLIRLVGHFVVVIIVAAVMVKYCASLAWRRINWRKSRQQQQQQNQSQNHICHLTTTKKTFSSHLLSLMINEVATIKCLDIIKLENVHVHKCVSSWTTVGSIEMFTCSVIYAAFANLYAVVHLAHTKVQPESCIQSNKWCRSVLCNPFNLNSTIDSTAHNSLKSICASVLKCVQSQWHTQFI